MDNSKTANPKTGQPTVITYAPTVWQSANFSQDWYRDMVREAHGTDESSTRREILFSACFLESYLFEWARGVDFENINDYFPLKSKRGLNEKWRLVPAKLHENGKIPRAPALDLSEVGTLVLLRNGLIHARASRPFTNSLHKDAEPIPALNQLGCIKHGWALGVALTLVLKLHKDVGTPPPGYLSA